MAFVTIRTIDGNVSKKGEVSSILETANFSRANRLPRVLRIEITGATAIQIEAWLGRLKSLIRYSVVSENPQRWRAKMEIDPDVVTATGMDASFKQVLKGYIIDDPHEGNWVATLVNQSATHLACDIAKGQIFDLTQVKGDINNFFVDMLEEVLHFRQFFFSDSVVDPRVIQGAIDEAANEDAEGNLPIDWVHDSITKAQALAVIVDRLA